MQALSAAKLLSVWEEALGASPVGRALALLSAACPESSAEQLMRLTIGQRDRLLLTLREWTFGPRLSGRVPCERCGEALELIFNVSDICASEAETPDALSLKLEGFEVSFRLPNSQDLSAVAACRDVSEARRTLLARCLLNVAEEGQPATTTVESLPSHVREAIAAQMAEADPQSDVQLRLSCPACGHTWLAAFDIVSYFWSEIHAWALRLLREVHTLAAAYGWREEDILAMSARRRHIYLELVGG